MKGLEKIRAKLAAKEPVIGTHVSLGDTMSSEMLSMAGFDFIWIDMEHTPMSNYDVLHHIIAVENAGAASFIRIPYIDPVTVKPILEMGPAGIIFPNVKTKEDAELAVASCVYPLKGIRGFGPLRAQRYGLTDMADYVADCDKGLWKIMQIEHVDAVNNLEEILAVDGVDAIIVGSNDLSASIGLLGQTGHPEVKKLMDTICEKARKTDKPFGVSMGYNPPVIKEWIARGINWIEAGGDVGYIMSAAKEALNGTMEMFKNR